ncbi:ADP-ribosylglycohydrolase family protein [Spartinivicinus ruber]|uniref:ADP-ribosylglycohydrolase family protein n=1 Tax=Spartinivicinus ruber TaxID=2683272 RepID=UPI0013D462B9|nr:ADP-ribosylglycohydrolase family protein [Spartinivicinus ruber]
MLVELAIGDAYGAGFEYVNKKVVKEHNNLQQYIQHPRHFSIKPGCYTDDTQMSLAIAELLISGEGWTPDNIANYFVNVFKRDPREGYASRFYQFLTDINDGKQFLEQIKPYSDKSGAAMRAGPIGLLADEKQVIEYATIQAKVTHDTAGGINSAVAAALMVHYCQYQLGDKRDLGRYLKSKIPGDWDTPWQGKVGHLGIDAVHAAVTAVVSHEDLSANLKQCVDYTGDVDTVATIALAAAACSKEIQQNLPAELYGCLENGQFGLDYLQKLDEDLIKVTIK